MSIRLVPLPSHLQEYDFISALRTWKASLAPPVAIWASWSVSSGPKTSIICTLKYLTALGTITFHTVAETAEEAIWNALAAFEEYHKCIVPG